MSIVVRMAVVIWVLIIFLYRLSSSTGKYNQEEIWN